jgi:hypothetical protein
MSDPQPENFGALPAIPNGWTVRLVEPDGGHFVVCDPAGEQQSCIHWNRYVVRKWALHLASQAEGE